MRNILKQTSWLFFAQLLTRLISFFYIIYLAKALTVSDFGLYTVSLAYFSIISAFSDFGFNRFLIREVARDRSAAPKLFWNIAILRLTFATVLFAIFSLILYSLDPDKIRVSLILLATLAILPQSIATTLDAIFVAVAKLQFSAVSLFAASISTVFLGFLLIENGFGPMGAVNALIIGQIVYVFVLLIFFSKHQGLTFSAINLSIIKKALVGSLPYGILSILGLLYFRIDTILLSYIKGNFEAGIYGAAYKALEAVIFIPGAFSTALFPALALLHDTDKKEMKKIYFKSIKLMGGIGLGLLLAYILILPPMVKLFLPDYIQSIEAIKILAFSIPFIFIATPGVQVLFSSEKYLKMVVTLSLFTVAFNVILNLIFIPQFGFRAAAWITVASDILSFIIFYLLITKKVFGNEK